METRTQQRDGEAERVPVVDDDPSLRLVCSVGLETEGLQVLEAADGPGALTGRDARCA